MQRLLKSFVVCITLFVSSMVEADTNEIGIDATVKKLYELTFNEDTTLHITAINIAPANIQKYKIVVKIENHEVAALPDVRNKATSDKTTDHTYDL